MAHESVEPAAAGDLGKVLDLIRDIRIALLTTVDCESAFHTRPVQTLAVEDQGTIWFFTDLRSGKAHELRADMRIALGYADTAANRYVAVTGTGTVQRDPQKAAELWQFEQRAYYPDGPNDERLGVLTVEIERAEYWIAPGRTSYLFAVLKAATTGTPAAVVGENQRAQRKSNV
jgi:general stress protein 26